jgi:hypothetical protein
MTYYPCSPLEIRDGTYDRLLKIQGLVVRKARTMATQVNDPDQFPNATVYNLGEETQPMGDANCGPPAFQHHLRLGIEVEVLAGNELYLEHDATTLVEQIRILLLSDYTWVNLFEGCERFSVDYAHDSHNDVYLVRAIINIEVTYKSIWEPIVLNDLDSVSISTKVGDCKTGNYVSTEIDLDTVNGKHCND